MVNIRDLMETGDLSRPAPATSGRRYPFTSKVMTAIWNYARELGLRNMVEFWEAMSDIGWDYYDVLHEISP